MLKCQQLLGIANEICINVRDVRSKISKVEKYMHVNVVCTGTKHVFLLNFAFSKLTLD